MLVTSGDICSGFQSQGRLPCLHDSSPMHNRFLRCDICLPLVASIAAESFRSTYLHRSIGRVRTCHCLTTRDKTDALPTELSRLSLRVSVWCDMVLVLFWSPRYTEGKHVGYKAINSNYIKKYDCPPAVLLARWMPEIGSKCDLLIIFTYLFGNLFLYVNSFDLIGCWEYDVMSFIDCSWKCYPCRSVAKGLFPRTTTSVRNGFAHTDTCVSDFYCDVYLNGEFFFWSCCWHNIYNQLLNCRRTIPQNIPTPMYLN